MQWNLKRTTEPPDLPVLVDEAKAQTRIDIDAEDELVERLLGAATDYIEGPYGIGVCMVEQEWELKLDCFPDCIKIPLYPVLSVEKIEYEDTDGATQTVDSDVYRVDTHSNPARITVEPDKQWPTPRGASNAVTVTFKAGYEPDDSGEETDYRANIPEALRHAVLLTASHWYENRSATSGNAPTEVPMAVESILSRYRVPGFA